jgi:hypothetical protein
MYKELNLDINQEYINYALTMRTLRWIQIFLSPRTFWQHEKIHFFLGGGYEEILSVLPMGTSNPLSMFSMADYKFPSKPNCYFGNLFCEETHSPWTAWSDENESPKTFTQLKTEYRMTLLFHETMAHLAYFTKSPILHMYRKGTILIHVNPYIPDWTFWAIYPGELEVLCCSAWTRQWHIHKQGTMDLR